MLEDFAEDLRQTLHQRLDNAFATLKGNGDPARPRGMIEAFESAIADLDDILIRYRAPESVPEQLAMDDEPVERPRRSYGRAA